MSHPLPSQRSWSDCLALSPELRTLVACGQAFLYQADLEAVHSTLSECPSAESVCKVALLHGMIGHLHRLVAVENLPGVDAALVNRLSDLQHAAEMRSLRQTAALLRLLEKLEGAGVRAMPIKGPAWAESLYGDVAMRVCADLDVLVSHDQMGAAREVALVSGYADAAWYNERVVEWHKEGWGHIEMWSKGANPYLELHWEVFVSIGCRSLRGEDLLAHATTGQLLGQEILVPSPTDSLLIDCVHGTKHEWDTVELMLGLAVRVANTSVEEWAGVLGAARRAGCRRRLVIGVAHVCEVFGLLIPAEIQVALDRDRIARLYLRHLKPAFLDKRYQKTAWEDLVRLLMRFCTEDSVLLSLRHATVRIFTPGPEDWESYSLPARLTWLYYPLRPARLAVKWLKRLLGVDRKRSDARRKREQG